MYLRFKSNAKAFYSKRTCVFFMLFLRFEVVTREYDVVVSTELIDPKNPDRGYRYEEKNVKETTKEAYDTLTFEITYN